MLFGCGTVVTTEARAVGRVRSLAANTALQRVAGPLRRCWLANTDADCCVPHNWLLDQLNAASGGVEAIAGTVNVDSFCEHRPGVDSIFRRKYLIHPDGSHPHVHGANLGVRADAYIKAGGWSHLETGEDHDLWNRLSKTGARTLSSSAITVRHQRPTDRTGTQWICRSTRRTQRVSRMMREQLLERLRSLIKDPMPLPGDGDTPGRHRRLMAVGRADLSLARLAEAHWDAVAILSEAGREPAPNIIYGVWASEKPGQSLSLERQGDRIRGPRQKDVL